MHKKEQGLAQEGRANFILGDFRRSAEVPQEGQPQPSGRERGWLSCSKKVPEATSGGVTLLPRITEGHEGPNSGAMNLILGKAES